MSPKPEGQTLLQGRKLTLWLVLIASGLAVVALVYFFFFHDARPGLDAWEAATIPYTSECGDDCTVAGTIGGAHGTEGAVMRYDPSVDDEVAQWGDCLQSIFVCMDVGTQGAPSSQDKAALINNCVSKSACPAVCTDEFASSTADDPESVLRAFEDVFIGDQAWCLPVEDGS
ncbi:MAG: hypothetical protein GY945_14285 [Rhodobacteraceae bacterium]|nr:hypothetical protein [Paracoccaceae bacterium]